LDVRKREYYLTVLSLTPQTSEEYLQNFTDTELEELIIVAMVNYRDTNKLRNLQQILEYRQYQQRTKKADKPL